ncbi:hypothetical protein GCK72_007106 [Caenorhabditis remanei]|uniref:Secreted protein n=1 Tax=Caenorhabditis remanei TaxID=31234 RepID=A0A6A5HKR0_CAERE|nr:hypothetical protein GCK72_007106 [Caenorhabditis remanei]KAF1767147.1 hypothetical protein GCK72_007106 [Caenorhabditis remanei]
MFTFFVYLIALNLFISRYYCRRLGTKGTQLPDLSDQVSVTQPVETEVPQCNKRNLEVRERVETVNDSAGRSKPPPSMKKRRTTKRR